MLVLSRTIGEKILIDGDRIVVEVVKIDGSRVMLGITAARDIPVHREEIYQAIQEGKPHDTSVKKQGQ